MIVIACNDPKLVNRWNRALGKKYPSYTVSQKTALVRAVSSLKPRLLILHIGFPRLRVGRELPAIQGLSPLTRVLVISDSLTTSEGISVLKAGAKGYCSSHINAALLKKAVKTVLQNELWAGHKVVTKLVEEMTALSRHEMLTARSKTPLDTLSARKRQIADLVIKGHPNKEIASRLNISEATVKSHLTAIFHRLQLSGRLKLALLSKAQTMTD
jgi:two-component system, NarL family, nitrate/nitrite response regulator NarL